MNCGFLLRRIRRRANLPRRLKPVLALFTVMLLLRMAWFRQQGDDTEGGLKDWHDDAAMKADEARKGVGEHGAPAFLPPEADKKLQSKLFRANGFNGLLSDYISLNRAVPDLRHPACRKKLYPRKLPTVSIVIPFHEEHLTVLLRTAASCMNRAPKELVKEVILVDDASRKKALGKELDRRLESPEFSRVRVVRAPEREGAIRGRIRGFAAATAEVVMIIDSHCECSHNWLPPLLEPIVEDYRTVVCPFIDVIKLNDFSIVPQDEGARGAWSWNNMHYKRLPLLPGDRRDPTQPFASPVMAGGLYAITRRWYYELGGYDEKLDIWGGEQYEISFKIWQCGGRMLDAPCSRISHIYRNFMPYSNPVRFGNWLGRNFKRVAEVWMDEYKEHLYQSNDDEGYSNLDTGDLSKAREVRERLKCRSFDWYMKNVAFDQLQKYPFYPPLRTAVGKLRLAGSDACVHVRPSGTPLTVASCANATVLLLNRRNEIRLKNESRCFDVPDNQFVQMIPCHGMRGYQCFKYFPQVRRLRQIHFGKCVAMVDRKLKIVGCLKSDPRQHWEWVP